MSEIREADEAVQARQEAISEAIAAATGMSALDVYRRLFIGMDIDVADAHELAQEHANAGCVVALESIDKGETVDLHEYLAAAWMDGFSVGCMVFSRRAER